MGRLSEFADRQSPLWKYVKVQYLETHVLDICGTLEDLLEAEQLRMIFLDKSWFMYYHAYLNWNSIQFARTNYTRQKAKVTHF